MINVYFDGTEITNIDGPVEEVIKFMEWYEKNKKIIIDSEGNVRIS